MLKSFASKSLFIGLSVVVLTTTMGAEAMGSGPSQPIEQRVVAVPEPVVPNTSGEVDIEAFISQLESRGGKVIAQGEATFAPKKGSTSSGGAQSLAYPINCTLQTLVYRTQPGSAIGNTSLTSCNMTVSYISHYYQAIKRSRWYGWEEVRNNAPFTNGPTYSLGYTSNPLFNCYGTIHNWRAETNARLTWNGQEYYANAASQINNFNCV